MRYLVTIKKNETDLIQNLTKRKISLEEFNLEFSQKNLSQSEYELLKNKYVADMQNTENLISNWWINIVNKYNLKIDDIPKYIIYFDSNKIFIR